MLLIMHYSVSTHWDVYKTLEMTIWDVLKFDNIYKYNNKYSLHVVNPRMTLYLYGFYVVVWFWVGKPRKCGVHTINRKTPVATEG